LFRRECAVPWDVWIASIASTGNGVPVSVPTSPFGHWAWMLTKASGTTHHVSLYRVLLKLAFDPDPACSSFAELGDALARVGWHEFPSGADAALVARLEEAAEEGIQGTVEPWRNQ